MIDKSDDQLTVKTQCKLLSLSRSTFYYPSRGISTDDLAMMRHMDELYMEDPTRGTRRYSTALSATKQAEIMSER